VRYLASAKDDKEASARAIAGEQRLPQGRWGFDLYRNRENKTLDLVQRSRKCLYVYQDWQHQTFGWLNARIATWFPLSIQICMKGRAWLVRQLDSAGIAYQQQDNCFPWVADWSMPGSVRRVLDTWHPHRDR